MLEPSVFQKLFASDETELLLRTPVDRAKQLLDEGFTRFSSLCAEQRIDLPYVGFREFAVKIDGKAPSIEATQSFLFRLHAATPSHSGWPPWVVLLGANDPKVRPYVLNDGWECFLPQLKDGVFGPSIDFWRLEQSGEMYHIRGLEDDFAAESGRGNAPRPASELDFMLQISRLAEAISVALAVARAMGFEQQSTSLAFAVRWQKISNRILTSWANSERMFRSYDPSVQDSLTAEFVLPLDTPAVAIAPFVESAVAKLFALFGGKEIESSVVQRIVEQTLGRRM